MFGKPASRCDPTQFCRGYRGGGVSTLVNGVRGDHGGTERWFRINRDLIWGLNGDGVRRRMNAIISDKDLLDIKLMDSQNEYFRPCYETIGCPHDNCPR